MRQGKTNAIWFSLICGIQKNKTSEQRNKKQKQSINTEIMLMVARGGETGRWENG